MQKSVILDLVQKKTKMKIDNKLISVIVPVYNTEKYLHKCIDSILNQTYRNLELLLIDDGSTDDSFLICRKYAELDKRIVLIQKENGGQSSARNLALDIATGDYIGFVDSDDWIEPDMFEVMLRAIADTNSDVALCNVCEAQRDPGEIYIKLLRDDIGSQLWKFLFSADCWKGIRMPLGRYAEDAAVVPMLLFDRKITIVNRELYHYYSSNPSSSSNALSKRFKNAIDRAVMFSDRYDWMKKVNVEKESQMVVMSKAASFIIGAMGRFGEEQQTIYRCDVNRLMRFCRENFLGIIMNPRLPITKKFAISLICISPKGYYSLRNNPLITRNKSINF